MMKNKTINKKIPLLREIKIGSEYLDSNLKVKKHIRKQTKNERLNIFISFSLVV